MKDDKIPIIEGKSKKFYKVNDEALFMVFKPHLRSITSKREENIKNTDLERLRVNLLIMLILEYNGIKTHLLGRNIVTINDKQGIYVKKVQTIPIEFIGRYYAAGSIVRLFPALVSEGEEFKNILLKFDYKQDIKIAGIDDPTLNESYIVGI